jgi:hypothetical protein
LRLRAPLQCNILNLLVSEKTFSGRGGHEFLKKTIGMALLRALRVFRGENWVVLASPLVLAFSAPSAAPRENPHSFLRDYVHGIHRMRGGPVYAPLKTFNDASPFVGFVSFCSKPSLHPSVKPVKSVVNPLVAFSRPCAFAVKSFSLTASLRRSLGEDMWRKTFSCQCCAGQADWLP